MTSISCDLVMTVRPDLGMVVSFCMFGGSWVDDALCTLDVAGEGVLVKLVGGFNAGGLKGSETFWPEDGLCGGERCRLRERGGGESRSNP